MQFVYLTPQERPDGVGLALVPTDITRADATVPKARTLLFILKQHKRLWSFPTDDLVWELHTPANDRTQQVALEPATDDPNVWAVIPVKPGLSIAKQPGVVMVRNNFEAQMLFTEWLDGSRRWLDHNPEIHKAALEALGLNKV